MIPDSVVDQVREHADIVAIIGEVVKLKRSGSSFRGPCPFHQGKDANFSVSPRGGYMCFVCHEKGDVFTFVQKRMGMDFVDAVKYVGAKSGIEVTDVSRDRDSVDPRERFWEMNAAAAEYFKRILWDEEAGAPAREYLAARKMGRDVADRFGMGFAPKDVAALRGYLRTLGYDDAQQLEAGLLVLKTEGEEPRPRFRNRLMFPIYDPQGRAIAFGGRVIGSGEPKYLNSAESPTFQKGGTLYGLNWAKQAIRRDERVLLVEGYFDCVRLMAAGIESVVAPLGTALTDAQAELIRKYTGNVFLLYDSDKAGLKATFRAGDVLLRQGVKVSVVTFPPGDDPDTYVAKYGREKLEAQLAGAIDVFERKLQLLQRGDWFSDLRRKRAALDRLLPTIRAAADPITFGIYVARTAEVARISQEALQQELRLGQRIGSSGPRQSQPSPSQTPSEPRRPASLYTFRERGWQSERELLRVLLHRAGAIDRVAEQVDRRQFRDARHSQIFGAILQYSDNVSPDVLAQRLPEHTVAHMQQLLSETGGLDRAVEIAHDSVSHIRERDVREQLDDLGEQLRLAAPEEKDEILRQIGSLSAQIRGGRRWKSFTQTLSGESR
jgi:DNA primase